MTFVWITCRRLQTSGALLRFADGIAPSRERREIEAHLARCPSCQAVVGDALAVADLLKANVPAAPRQSLAVSGDLWATLESTIASTPQEKAFPAAVRAPKPRLQQFGQWLATPGGLPFGTVAAAAVVGMIWLHQHHGVPTETNPPLAVAAAGSAAPAEISLLPAPPAPKALAASAQIAPAKQVRSAPLVVAANTDRADFEIAPLKREASVRTLPAAAPRREVFRLAAPSAPRAPIQLADAAPSAPAAAAPMPLAPTMSKRAEFTAPAPSPGAADRTTETHPERLGSGGNPAFDQASPAPVQMAKAMTTAAPSVSVAANTGAPALRVEEGQDGAAARSALTEMALQQRRKRSLFSYATR